MINLIPKSLIILLPFFLISGPFLTDLSVIILGLIYSIKNHKNNIVIEMTLTNPNCPVAGQMPGNVAKSIEQISGLRSIEVKLVWKPAWSKDLMSDDAKLALDIF